MQSNQTATKTIHTFSLVSLKPDCHYKSIFTDFTPPPSLNKASNSIVPVYLLDRNFYTQAFVVAREKEYYATTSAVERVKFDARISKANQLCCDLEGIEEAQAQLCLPVPTNNYCQVCKNTYQQYEDHLKESSHQRQARFSKANTYISQLCKAYSKKSSKASAKPKGKQIRKSQSIKESTKKGKKAVKEKGRGIQNGLGTKQHNCSTNIPSLVPTPYC